MTGRLRRWIDETHGTGFEMLRHFLAHFFHSEMLSSTGEWQKVAVGLLAALLSAGVVVVKMYSVRYTQELILQSATTPIAELYRRWVRADLMSFIGLAMVLTALATLLEWQALFPSRKDYLALAAMPVRPREIFRAKFSALLAVFAGFLVALNLPLAVAFASVTAGPWQENPSGLFRIAANFSATAGASAFVFFGLLAVQGILLNVVPARLFERLSLSVQAGLFIAAMGALPLLARQPAAVPWWPPVWFRQLWEAIEVGAPANPWPALAAIAAAPICAVLSYILSYHRFRRLLLETPPDRPNHSSRAGLWLLERFIPDPREQAAFAFIWKTLARSGFQRMALLAYAGLALGWIVASALDAPRPGLRDQGMYGLLLVLAPLATAMLATAGMRYIFSLPVAIRANWVFQIVDGDGRRAWLAAVERFVLSLGIAPVMAASLPAGVFLLGWARATAILALTGLGALIWFEARFRHWNKLPFTCSYLPGKTPPWLLVVRYGLGTTLLVPAGKLILYSSGDIAAFAALSTFEAVLWAALRRTRRARWAQTALSYEERPEAALLALDLEPSRETQPERPALVRTSTAMFEDTLVASRGWLSANWADEVAEDRRRPRLLLDTFLADVRFGFRMIRQNPLLSSVLVLTLVAGIGVNTSIFTVVEGLALRPAVYRDPEAFVRILPVSRLQNQARQSSYAEYAGYRDHSRSLRRLAAWGLFPAFVGEDGAGDTVGAAVSCNFFEVDGIEQAVLGRLFRAEDCTAPGSVPPAVIAEGLWKTRFASDPRILGRTIALNGRPVSVVGVVPYGTASWTRSERGTKAAGIWVPFTAQSTFEVPSADLYGDGEQWLFLAGRLAPGFSRSECKAELEVLARQQDKLHPGRKTAIVTTDGSWIKELELTLSGQQLMLIGLVVAGFNLVLLISCANVAMLLLARATARRREIAVRLSLGAPRIRLVRMLVTESLIVSAIAGAISLYLAWNIPEPLYRMIAGRAPDFRIEPDWRTFLYVAVAVIFTGVAAGLAPALQAVQVDMNGAMKPASGASGGWWGARRLQALLVSAQVAMSMVLLVEAALFARAEESTLHADPGFLSRQVVIAPLYLGPSNPSEFPSQAMAARLLAIAERVRAIPGVRSLAFSEGMPLFSRLTVEISPPSRPDVSQPVDVYTASPRFFETFGIPLVRGREFEIRDGAAVIVSESLARGFWPRQDPIGQTVTSEGRSATVVGVVRDIDPLRFGGSDNPALYRPWRGQRNVLIVRFDSGGRGVAASGAAAAVRAAIRQAEPDLLVIARLAQSWIDQMTEDIWNVVSVILILGVLATLLAASGIYGAVSFAVNQRTRELGIRVALGARRVDIVRDVLVSGGRPVLQGLIVGMWLSVATAAAVRGTARGMPIRLDSSNPLLYAGAALLLAGAAGLAMIGPARRGSRSDPIEALRCE